MNSTIKSESGAALIARSEQSIVRPFVSCAKLLNNLSIPRGTVIEVVSDPDSPPFPVFAEFVCESILPSKFGGREECVFYVDCDQMFSIARVVDLVESKIYSESQESGISTDSEQITDLIDECLKRLHYVQIHSSDELIHVLQSHLDPSIIRKEFVLNLLIIDRVSSFNWCEKRKNVDHTYAKLISQITIDHGLISLIGVLGIRKQKELEVERIDNLDEPDTVEASPSPDFKLNSVMSNENWVSIVDFQMILERRQSDELMTYCAFLKKRGSKDIIARSTVLNL